jgi:hypothetical protein
MVSRWTAFSWPNRDLDPLTIGYGNSRKGVARFTGLEQVDSTP